LFLQKGVTPHEKSSKNLSSGTISIVIDLSLKSIQMISSVFFLNFFMKYFLKNMKEGAKCQFFGGGGETITLNPGELVFFGFF